MKNIEVLSPRGKVTGTTGIPVSHRLGDLNHKKIGVLNNTKGGAEMLFPYVEAALKRRTNNMQFKTWRIPYGLSPDPRELRLKEIAGYSDGVIALLGD